MQQDPIHSKSANQQRGSENEIDLLINDLFSPTLRFQRFTLEELFNERIQELGLNRTSAQEVLKINYRALTGILTGKQKLVDFTSLIKLADFLQVDKQVVFELFSKQLSRNFPEESAIDQKILFIKQNFDIHSLKKAGFIDSIADFDHIEKKLLRLFGLRSIFEYKPKFDKIFSSTKLHKDYNVTAENFTHVAEKIIENIVNPNKFSKEALVKYLSELKPLNLDVDFGLIEAFKGLYKIGVNAIFLEKIPSLHIRGATFFIGETPCIVITDYRRFYPTLWFALIHEIYHLIFHEEKVKSLGIHLTVDSNESDYEIKAMDKEADNFAVNYWISEERMKHLSKYISNHTIVEELGKQSMVHPSFFYSFYAFDKGNQGINYPLAQKYSPEFTFLKSAFPAPWGKEQLDPKEIAMILKSRIYID